jgi:hypothetical protein
MGVAGTDYVMYVTKNSANLQINSNTGWVYRGNIPIPGANGSTLVQAGEATNKGLSLALIGDNDNSLTILDINPHDVSGQVTINNVVVKQDNGVSPTDFDGEIPTTVQGSTSNDFTYVGTQSGSIFVYTSDGRFLEKINNGSQPISSIATSPDLENKYVITADVNNQIKLSQVDPTKIPCDLTAAGCTPGPSPSPSPSPSPTGSTTPTISSTSGTNPTPTNPNNDESAPNEATNNITVYKKYE